MTRPLVYCKYIGVFGTSENEEGQAIAHDSSVVMQSNDDTAMTALIIQTEPGQPKTMQFILPEEYDSLWKIPKPTNPCRYHQAIPAPGWRCPSFPEPRGWGSETCDSLQHNCKGWR
jgi:hypothetical protein